MTNIITIANHKGGCGKTTTTASVGGFLADKGYRVLLVDLDAQANLTSCFLSDEQDSSIYGALLGQHTLPIVPVRENLDIVPASLELARVELELSGKISREFILRRLLESIKDRYDYMLLDCPPSLGLVTINALAASTDAYISLTAEALPTKGLKMLLDVVDMVKQINSELSLGGIIITRWENSKLSQMVESTLRTTYGDKVFRTKIRKNIALAEAPLYTQDIARYSPKSNGAEDYQALTEEIINRTAND